MIRLATERDIPEIVRLGSRSLIDGPYAGIIADRQDLTSEFALKVIGSLGFVLLADESDHICGLLGVLVTPHYWTGEVIGSEVMWYVEPEHRKGGVAIKLLWEAERIAKERGATSMVFAAPTTEVAALYERFGYKLLDVNFRKVF